jgi:hypothetical protein
VRTAGLAPALPWREADFKSAASTGFATSARRLAKGNARNHGMKDSGIFLPAEGMGALRVGG